MKFLKKMKNKKYKALAAAVAMSTVMGVCGNTMAAKDYYGTSDGKWTDDVTKATSGVFSGVWMFDSGKENGMAQDIIGSRFPSGDSRNNRVSVAGGLILGSVYGGKVYGRNAIGNQVYIYSSGALINDVYGGCSTAGSVYDNKVYLSPNSIISRNVYGGCSYGPLQKAYNNTVDIAGYVNVGGTVYGGPVNGEESESKDNTLNFFGRQNRFGAISDFQNINFLVDDRIPILGSGNYTVVYVNEALHVDQIQSLNANIKSYGPNQVITLVETKNGDLSVMPRDILKINDKKAEYIDIADKSSFDEIKNIAAIGAVWGYDITQNAIKLKTQYKLLDDITIADDIALSRELRLNGKTLKMAQDPSAEAVHYNTLKVEKLTGTGNMTLDADLYKTLNDKIDITGNEPNHGTINFANNSIVVRRDHESNIKGLEEDHGEITVVTGNTNGITLIADSVKSATSNYIYTFTPGAPGKLNYTQILHGEFEDFIPGNYKYNDVNIITLNENKVVARGLGTTNRTGQDKVLTLAFNKGVTLSGDEKKHEGLVVAKGYTLKLEGQDGGDPGQFTKFKTAATVKNGATLEVANMKFEGNEKDIVNDGTLKLSGSNSINNISNNDKIYIDGNNTINNISNNDKAYLKGTNTITTVSGTGDITVEAGKTTVKERFEQTNATVQNGAELVVNGEAKISEVINASKFSVNGAVINQLSNTGTANLNSSQITTLSNTGTANLNGNQITDLQNDRNVYLKGTNTFAKITGAGHMEVDAGVNTVNGTFNQNSIRLNNDSQLVLKDNATVGSGVIYRGDIQSYGILTINDNFTNYGSIVLKNDATFNKGIGPTDKNNAGKIHIDGGTTTVNGDYRQWAFNVNKGQLVLNGNGKINTLNTQSEGAVTVNGNVNVFMVKGTGSITIENGVTTVDDGTSWDFYGFQQANVNIKNGSLILLNNAAADSINIDAGASLRADRSLKIKGSLNNNGVVSINSKYKDKANVNDEKTLSSVTGTGTFNVNDGKITVTGVFDQKVVNIKNGSLILQNNATADSINIDAGASLQADGSLNIKGSLNNNGVVSINSKYKDIDNVNDGKTLSSVTGTGTFNVNDGKTTVTDVFGQNVVNVNKGQLVLNGNGNIDTLNTQSEGAVTVNGNVNVYRVKGTGTFNVNDGKTTVTDVFDPKVVNVNKGGRLELTGRAFAAKDGSANGNIVNINGGIVERYIYGGLSKGDTYDNTVNITAKGYVRTDVFGGVSQRNAYRNTVNVSDSTVESDVFGGLASTYGAAYENIVNISDSEVSGDVYGGIDIDGTGTRNRDNVVNISDSTVGGVIFGGSADAEADNMLFVTRSKDKTMKAGNIANFQILGFSLPDGYNRSNAILTLTNNENTSLNLDGEGSVFLISSPKNRLVKGDKVNLIQKSGEGAFELKGNGDNTALYFGGPAYILKGSVELDSWDDGMSKNDMIFVVGDHIRKDEPTPTPQPQPEPKLELQLDLGPQPDPDKKSDLNSHPQPDPKLASAPQPAPTPQPASKSDIIPTPPSEPSPKPEPPKPEPVDPIDYEQIYNEYLDNAKTFMETRANGAALLNESSDFLMNQALGSAKLAAKESMDEGSRSLAPFAAVGGGKLRYNTGSHVDNKSWYGAVGLAKQVKDLTFGIAVQHGNSSYDSYVNAAHSEGDSKFTGVAIFAEKKTKKGLHYDAAIRGGRIKNKYSASLKYSVPGLEPFATNYDESSTFYGISLGLGKEITLRNKNKVDIYGRYTWTHTNSSNAMTNWEDDLSFDGINSHRIMLGSRYTHTLDARNEMYVGLGWQYELGGKVKGSIYGYSAPEPSLKGSSGMLELGWKTQADKNMTLELNVNGWAGKQRGIMGGLNLKWMF